MANLLPFFDCDEWFLLSHKALNVIIAFAAFIGA